MLRLSTELTCCDSLILVLSEGGWGCESETYLAVLICSHTVYFWQEETNHNQQLLPWTRFHHWWWNEYRNIPRSLLKISVVQQGQISLVRVFSEVKLPRAGVAERSHGTVHRDAGTGGDVQGQPVLGQRQESDPRVPMGNGADMAGQH